MKACVISAAMTGSGKTTITLGLLAALRKRGTAVQPFKVGPDFIDPGLHELASASPSHNLDGWMLPRETNEWLFAEACAGKQAALVEGVMGLFDGFDGKSDQGTTAEMARWLDLPVLLVMDANALGRSAAALVSGIRSFDPRLRFAGVIFNRVSGAGHFEILRDAVQDVPVLGWLPSEPQIEIPERHLGLLTGEEQLPRDRIESIREFVERHIDVEGLMQRLPSASVPRVRITMPAADRRRRVAVAHDAAFSFYYRANLIALARAGADIVEFSPLRDPYLPEADLLYLGGGYPELYSGTLSGNRPMLEAIRRFVKSGKPCYAECAGLMYLSERIGADPMAGVVPTAIEMTANPVDFGYCEVTTRRNSILGAAGTVARGHQFHHSRALRPSPAPVYDVAQRSRRYEEGFELTKGVASYVHLHFLSNRDLARNMLQS